MDRTPASHTITQQPIALGKGRHDIMQSQSIQKIIIFVWHMELDGIGYLLWPLWRAPRDNGINNLSILITHSQHTAWGAKA